MSRLIELMGGKVPQRSLRYLDRLPYVVSYEIEENQTLLGVDFGGSLSAYIIQTHASKRAKPIEVNIYDISENFAGTTKGKVQFGDGTDADEFAVTDDFVDAALTTTLGSKHYSSAAGTLNIGDTEIIQPADYVTVTCVANVTSATGIARVSVSFMYFD